LVAWPASFIKPSYARWPKLHAPSACWCVEINQMADREKGLGKMKFNRKSKTFGLVGLGMVGALVTGSVVAAQAATSGGVPTPPVTTTSSTIGARQFGHMAGMSFGHNSPMTAVASYLGLSQTQLQNHLQSGKSLAHIAQAQSKSVSGLEDAMIAALEANFDTNSTLTSDQKASAVEQMRNGIDTMVKATHTPGQGMGMSMRTRMGIGAGSEFGAGLGMHPGPGMGTERNPGMGLGMATTLR
jgi:cytochrome c553